MSTQDPKVHSVNAKVVGYEQELIKHDNYVKKLGKSYDVSKLVPSRKFLEGYLKANKDFLGNMKNLKKKDAK